MSYDEHLISMAGGEPDLDAIQARWDAAQKTLATDPHIVSIMQLSRLNESANDVPALLALVRSQQAQIERVEAVASDLAERGEQIEEKFERNGNGSIFSTRQEGRGIGYREAARNIRAALTATEGAGQ